MICVDVFRTLIVRHFIPLLWHRWLITCILHITPLDLYSSSGCFGYTIDQGIMHFRRYTNLRWANVLPWAASTSVIYPCTTVRNRGNSRGGAGFRQLSHGLESLSRYRADYPAARSRISHWSLSRTSMRLRMIPYETKSIWATFFRASSPSLRNSGPFHARSRPWSVTVEKSSMHGRKRFWW